MSAVAPTRPLRHGVVTMEVPTDFHEVPLDDAVEDRVAAQAALVGAMCLADPRQREGVELYVESLARHVRAGRVGAAAFCLVDIDGTPSTATLTVALHPAGTADPTVSVLGVVESLRRTQAYDEVRVDRVGGRPAVVATAVHPGDGDAPRTGEREVVLGVPVPGHDQVALLCVTSPDRDRWPLYERLARDVAASVRLQP